MLNTETRNAIKRQTDRITQQLEVNLSYFDHVKPERETLDILQGHIADCVGEIERLTQ